VSKAVEGKANRARTCGTTEPSGTTEKNAFLESLLSSSSGLGLKLDEDSQMLSAAVELQFKLANKTTKNLEEIAKWSAAEGVEFAEDFMNVKIPR